MNDYESLRDAATNEEYHGRHLCAGTRRTLNALFREIDRRAHYAASGAHYAAMHSIAEELGLDWGKPGGRDQ